MNGVQQYLVDTVPHFLAYFGAAAALAVVYLALYVRVTPHREFELIRGGNTAAAIQLVAPSSASPSRSRS